VPPALARLGTRFPLVILSNAAPEQIGANVARLGAAFHEVLTAEAAGAYKPRFQAFEYLLDRLGCRPEDILHVSSSPRYDLVPARDLGISHTVYVDRGYEPDAPVLPCPKVSDLAGVAELLGCQPAG
jgi:2-haloacid dehalogenase